MNDNKEYISLNQERQHFHQIKPVVEVSDKKTHDHRIIESQNVLSRKGPKRVFEVQLLTLHRAAPRIPCLRPCSLSSGRLGNVTTALGSLFFKALSLNLKASAPWESRAHPHPRNFPGVCTAQPWEDLLCPFLPRVTVLAGVCGPTFTSTLNN